MKIVLNDKYRITSDAHNYILQEKRYPDPKHRFTVDPKKFKWIDLGYYGNFKLLVNTLLEREIKHSEATSLVDILKRLEHIKNTVKNDIERMVTEK